MTTIRLSKRKSRSELLNINKSLKKYNNYKIINNKKLQNKLIKKFGGGKDGNIYEKKYIKYKLVLAKLEFYNKIKSILRRDSHKRLEDRVILTVLKSMKALSSNIYKITKLIDKNIVNCNKIKERISTIKEHVNKIITRYADKGNTIFNNDPVLKKLNDRKRAIKKTCMYYSHNKIHELIVNYREKEYSINKHFDNLIENIKEIFNSFLRVLNYFHSHF